MDNKDIIIMVEKSHKDGKRKPLKKDEVQKDEEGDVQVKLLRDVVVDVAGEGAEGIVKLLYKKKNVNEFLIAKKLDLTVNQVRNILYKLSYQGVVSYVKKKDKRKGWYTFFWRIEVLKALELLERVLLKKIFCQNTIMWLQF